MARPDHSEYVAHFTKNAASYAAIHQARQSKSPPPTAGSALQRLGSILTDRRIKASGLPWVKNACGVCFTESPWWSLVEHAKEYSPFGIGFTKESVFAAGGGPVHYLRQDVFQAQFDGKEFEQELYAFMRPFHPQYAPANNKFNGGHIDYSREREWCVPKDFDFTDDQVAFLVVQSADDIAALPQAAVTAITKKKILLLDTFLQIESLWPTHII